MLNLIKLPIKGFYLIVPEEPWSPRSFLKVRIFQRTGDQLGRQFCNTFSLIKTTGALRLTYIYNLYSINYLL